MPLLQSRKMVALHAGATNLKAAIAARWNSNWWKLEIYATYYAFAALKKDGTVECWGDEESGGDCSEVQQQLVDVEKIYATTDAFAALKKDGTVVCWGADGKGGDCCGGDCSDDWSGGDCSDDWSGDDCSEEVQQLVVVETIYATEGALVDVETIYATEGAFAAVKKDRTVVCWGSGRDGADCSAVQQQLVDVETIHATCAAFAAVLRKCQIRRRLQHGSTAAREGGRD